MTTQPAQPGQAAPQGQQATPAARPGSLFENRAEAQAESPAASRAEAPREDYTRAEPQRVDAQRIEREEYTPRHSYEREQPAEPAPSSGLFTTSDRFRGEEYRRGADDEYRLSRPAERRGRDFDDDGDDDLDVPSFMR